MAASTQQQVILAILLISCLEIRTLSGDLLLDVKASAYTTFEKSDDGTTGAINFPAGVNFPFFLANQTAMFVSMDGVLSFNNPFSQYSLPPPFTFATSFLAPFWADINGFQLGQVHYRHSQVAAELNSVKQLIETVFPPGQAPNNYPAITPRYLFIATWENVSPCGCFYPRNNFQVILVTDYCMSYAIFCYSDVQWGNDEGARVGVYRHLTNAFNEHQASALRSILGLASAGQSGCHVFPLGGQDVCAVDPDCAGKANGNYIDNNLCLVYYRCDNQKKTTLQCDAGFLFNSVTRVCVNWRTSGVPAGCQHPECQPPIQDGFTVVDNFCTRYYRCQGGFRTDATCAANTFMDVTLGQCTANVPTTCFHPRCINQNNGFYLETSGSCTIGFQCQNQFLRNRRVCDANFYYDTTSGTCVSTVPSYCPHPLCLNRPTGFYLEVNGNCAVGFRCAASLLSNRLTCNPPSSYYNTADGTCLTTSVPAYCPHPRCIGQNNGFYLEVAGDCRIGFRCQNTLLQNRLVCGTNTYYNTADGSCTSSFVPSYCPHPLCVGKGNGFFLEVAGNSAVGFRCTNNLLSNCFTCTGETQYYVVIRVTSLGNRL